LFWAVARAAESILQATPTLTVPAATTVRGAAKDVCWPPTRAVEIGELFDKVQRGALSGGTGVGVKVEGTRMRLSRAITKVRKHAIFREELRGWLDWDRPSGGLQLALLGRAKEAFLLTHTPEQDGLGGY
jgi:hypothetical protein